MLQRFFAIAANTCAETLRQPIYGVVIAATVLVLVFSPSLVMFTLDDDNLLLRDIGLSTLLVAGMLLGVFAAATTVTEEIETRTALTVISKTVGRGAFILGKFAGIAAAVLLGEYLLSLVLLMVVRHGVLQAAYEHSDLVVITLGAAALLLTFLAGLAANYFYRWRFSSTAILLGALLGTITLALLAFINVNWQFSREKLLAWELLRPILLVVLAVLILSAVALAAATRTNMTLTLVICSLVFLLGAVTESSLGPLARSGHGLAHYAAWIPLALLPNISFFLVTNAIYQNTTVPLAYLAQAALYALLYVTACLLFAIALFRSRDLG